MKKCHECAEVVEKLNKEYEELHKEKEFYKSKMNMKNELIKKMIEEEKEIKKIYIKILNEHMNNNDINYNRPLVKDLYPNRETLFWLDKKDWINEMFNDSPNTLDRFF